MTGSLTASWNIVLFSNFIPWLSFFFFFQSFNYFFSHLVSNETPEHPCISPVSGHIFERRLLEKYIQENGTDPMNGEKLTVDVLVDVKGKNCSDYANRNTIWRNELSTKLPWKKKKFFFFFQIIIYLLKIYISLQYFECFDDQVRGQNSLGK